MPSRRKSSKRPANKVPDLTPLLMPVAKPIIDGLDPADLRSWTWADHALQMCQERGIGVYEVLSALTDPDWTQPGNPQNSPRLCQVVRGDVAVVHNPLTREILSVIDRQVARDTPRRPLHPATTELEPAAAAAVVVPSQTRRYAQPQPPQPALARPAPPPCPPPQRVLGDTTVVFAFADPPANPPTETARTVAHIQAVTGLLEAHPGRWAQVAVIRCTPQAIDVRRRYLQTWLNDPRLQLLTSPLDDTSHGVFARFRERG